MQSIEIIVDRFVFSHDMLDDKIAAPYRLPNFIT